MIAVLDASAVVELVLRTRSGMEILKRISDPKLSLHSPELVDSHVLSVLRRYEQTNIIPPDRIAHAIDGLSDLDMHRHPHGPLLPRIWSWRYNLTVYVAAYVALGEALGAPLLTTDARLARAPAPGSRGSVRFHSASSTGSLTARGQPVSEHLHGEQLGIT